MSSTGKGPGGPLAIIGGRFESDNEALFSSLKPLCNNRIAVLSMASGYPEEVGQELVDDFSRHGFEVELVPLFWENRATAAFDPQILEHLNAFGSIFFSGGNQARIVETLIQEDEETPALACIRGLHAAGGLIAGTSAGAAVMSGPMILSGTSVNALAEGLSDDPTEEDGFRLGHGLGLFQWGLIDQHFLQRGRIGRLLAACRALSQPLAFGIDENSALLVENHRARVVGETGAILLDCRKAVYGEGDAEISQVRVSYLDDGDAIDLASGKAIPAADKKRVRVTRASYRRPAPVRRPAFAGYAIHDLLLRLVEGDPAYYRHDSAQAYHAPTHSQLTLEIERVPRRARALRAVRDGEIRYSALGFDLRLRRRQLPPGQRPETSTTVLPPDPAPGARLVLLGNSPMTWREEDLATLLPELREPVGIFATASGTPRKMAGQYLDWLRERGLRAEILDVTLSNIERASRDRSLLKRIGSMGSLLFTGGDQRRLTEALLHCAEATPVLHAVVSAYERGIPLVGVAAAASAFAGRMIVNGDSRAALRYGSSEDAGFSGVVVEQGIGVTDVGLIDQNFLDRHRLGRLLVACAAQRAPYGFGLCEQSGLIIAGGERRLQAIGQKGVIVVSLDPARVQLQAPEFDPAGIRLHFVEPGNHFHLDTAGADAMDRSGTGLALLERAIADLATDYNASLAPDRPPVDDSLLRQEWTRPPGLF